MTNDQIAARDGYQVFDAGRQFGSPFGQRRSLSTGWDRSDFGWSVKDGVFVVVGVHPTFNTFLVCRPNDVDAARDAARKLNSVSR